MGGLYRAKHAPVTISRRIRDLGAPAPPAAILGPLSGLVQLPVLRWSTAHKLHVSSLKWVSFTPVPGCSQLTFTPPIFGSTCACRCEQFRLGCECQYSDALGLFFGSWRWCQHREAFRSVEGGARGVPRRMPSHRPNSPKSANAPPRAPAPPAAVLAPLGGSVQLLVLRWSRAHK